MLAYACGTEVVHRPPTTLLHRVLFCASLTISRHLYPAASISAWTLLLHVYRGLPTFLFPWGFHCSACLVIEWAGLRRVCPIQLHFLFLSSDSMGVWLVFSHSVVFVIFSGHLIFNMRWCNKSNNHNLNHILDRECKTNDNAKEIFYFEWSKDLCVNWYYMLNEFN